MSVESGKSLRVRVRRRGFKGESYTIETPDNKFIEILTGDELREKLRSKELILDCMLEGFKW